MTSENTRYASRLCQYDLSKSYKVSPSLLGHGYLTRIKLQNFCQPSLTSYSTPLQRTSYAVKEFRRLAENKFDWIPRSSMYSTQSLHDATALHPVLDPYAVSPSLWHDFLKSKYQTLKNFVLYFPQTAVLNVLHPVITRRHYVTSGSLPVTLNQLSQTAAHIPANKLNLRFQPSGETYPHSERGHH